jgi:hypothetical protein
MCCSKIALQSGGSLSRYMIFYYKPFFLILRTEVEKVEYSKSSSKKRVRSGKMEPISSWVQTYVGSRGLWVLRERKTDKAVDVALSKEGLKWVVDSKGDYIFFKDATTRVNKLNGIPVKIEFIENSPQGLQPSDDYYTEQFIPRDHYRANGNLNSYPQGAEYLACKKAVDLLKPYNSRSFVQKDRLIWTTSNESSVKKHENFA